MANLDTNVPGACRKHGDKTGKRSRALRKRCTRGVSAEYYEGVGAPDNEHPWRLHHLRGIARQGSRDPPQAFSSR